MRKHHLGSATLLAVSLLASGAFAGGPTASGSLTVTATVQSGISLSILNAGGMESNMGTANASTDLGSVSKYGAAPSGFSIATFSDHWVLASTNGIGIDVTKSNLTSTDYTLTAQLASAPASGIAWYVDSVQLTDADPVTLATSATYGQTLQHPWSIVLQDSASAASINNVIDFVATAN